MCSSDLSNRSLYKEKIVDNLLFNDEIINYGSLGSLIYFLRNLTKLPELLLINYLDKQISVKDIDNMLKNIDGRNLVSGSLMSDNLNTSSEQFFNESNKYFFNGFLILNKKTLAVIKQLDNKYFFHNLPYIINSNLFRDFKFSIIENKDDIKEIREKIEVAKILLGSKSKSIHNLRDIKTAEIPKFKVLDKSELKDIEKKLQGLGNILIVRSDSEFEDSFSESNAGKFLSIGPVNKKNKKEIEKAIQAVLNSYPVLSDESRVLIQDYVAGIKSSGVITTRILQNGAPYICISLDRKSVV